jgi:hypothetical protein
VPVDITVFPAAYHLDVNNDGFKDLLVAPNNPNTSENYNNVWFYENYGTDEQPDFGLQQFDFLQNGMIDLGERSFPAFFDWDKDVRMDIIVGSYGYFESAGEYSSRLMLLSNSGTSSHPEYYINSEDFNELGQYGFKGIYPAFGDMDGDGDGDMIIGDEEGNLHYFINSAPPEHVSTFELEQPNYQGIDVGQSAKPQIIDVDRDGLPDLLIGERSGTVKYFRNTGSLENADFDAVPTVEEFGGIDVMPECCTGFSAPFLAEDSLGSYVLYVGSEQGMVYLYGDIDNNLTGTFTLLDSLYLHGVNVNLSGADINNDGKLEFVYGEAAGGLGLLKAGKPQNLGTGEMVNNDELISIFPNPVEDVLTIELPGSLWGHHPEISIINMMGKQVECSVPSIRGTQISIQVQGLPRGIYLLQVNGSGKRFSGKFIKF